MTYPIYYLKSILPYYICHHSESGVTLVKDIKGNVWSLLKDDNTVINKTEFKKILDNHYHFYELPKHYRMTSLKSMVFNTDIYEVIERKEEYATT